MHINVNNKTVWFEKMPVLGQFMKLNVLSIKQGTYKECRKGSSFLFVKQIVPSERFMCLPHEMSFIEHGFWEALVLFCYHIKVACHLQSKIQAAAQANTSLSLRRCSVFISRFSNYKDNLEIEHITQNVFTCQTSIVIGVFRMEMDTQPTRKRDRKNRWYD